MLVFGLVMPVTLAALGATLFAPEGRFSLSLFVWGLLMIWLGVRAHAVWLAEGKVQRSTFEWGCGICGKRARSISGEWCSIDSRRHLAEAHGVELS